MAYTQVIVACVAENNEVDFHKVTNLVRSIKTCPGNISHSKLIVYFVENVQYEFKVFLEQMDVEIRVATCFDERYRHANKLRMLEIEQSLEYDVLIALDIDTVVVQDFTQYLSSGAVGAKPVDQNPLTLEEWNELFEFFNLPMPTQRYVTSFTYEPTVPYFNSGVLVVPKKYVGLLRESWGGFVKRLLDTYSSLPNNISKHSFFTDQFALSLAIQAARLPVIQLPVEMNFPTHFPVHRSLLPDEIDPFILHYHNKILKNGELDLCTHKKTNEKIKLVNNRIKPKPRLTSFNNLNFWEYRYKTNIELGSGFGSRGKHLLYKRQLLNDIYNITDFKSVLDVGCGDIEVITGINFKNYTGIDMSPFIVNRNAKIKPNYKFLCADFTLLDTEPLKADLVLCFDVLIHLHDYDVYNKFVSQLFKVTKKTFIISGYNSIPTPEYTSDITKYHEPLTTTIARFTAKPFSVIGEYRGVIIVKVNLE
jgi:SAM-dependent methyltransferase